MQRTIESAQNLFQEITLDHCIVLMVETKVFSFLENANQNSAEGNIIYVRRAVEKPICRVFTQDAFNKVIHMKFNILADSQDFVQQLT